MANLESSSEKLPYLKKIPYKNYRLFVFQKSAQKPQKSAKS